MFPFDIPNHFRSILAGDFWSTKATDTDTKVTVSCKGLFYWHSGIFIWLRITVKTGKLHSVSLLEMRLLGNWHESSNLSVSAKNDDRMNVRSFFVSDIAFCGRSLEKCKACATLSPLKLRQVWCTCKLPCDIIESQIEMIWRS